MVLGAGDLVLCSGTLARATSFRDRVDAALAGGFAGISLWGRDYWGGRRDGLTDADMRIMLADNGLGVAEIDLAWWWLPGASDIQIPESLDTRGALRVRRSQAVPGSRSGGCAFAQRHRRVRWRLDR